MKLGQGNVFTGICDSVNRGVCLGACWDSTHTPGPGTPWTRHPPGPGIPLGPGTPPGTRHPPWYQAPPQTRHPPGTEHAGRYSQHTGGTHPTGMQTSYHLIYTNSSETHKMRIMEIHTCILLNAFQCYHNDHCNVLSTVELYLTSMTFISPNNRLNNLH